MRKIIFNLALLFLFFFTFLIIIISTIGIETNKFNKLISNKAYQSQNINLDLETIRFKLDLKELSLFLETQNPKITYRNLSLPVQNLKIYIDFFSVLKSSPRIIKTNLILKELDIVQLNKFSAIIKPSNFKSLINNKVKEGKLISEIEIFLNEKGLLENFITKGTIKDLKAELLDNLKLSKTNLSFFADKNDILIKNIFGNLEDIKILDGDLKINLENGLSLNSNFNSKIDLDENLIKKYNKFLNKNNLTKNIRNFKANLNNSFSINLDETYKLKNYEYKILGNIEKSKLQFLSDFKNSFITEETNEIYLSNLKVQTTFSPKNITFKGDGEYSFNNKDFLKINLENKLIGEFFNLKLNFDYTNSLDIKLINYKKSKNSIANFSVDLEKKKNKININQVNYNEGNNYITIDKLIFKDKKFFSFNKIRVNTNNNDFLIKNENTIKIKGNKFDATNLAKLFDDKSDDNKFQSLNGNIEIDFKNIKVPMSEKLENFKLIGEIKKGKFVKISSKGDFGGNNFLDISMKKEKTSEKKFLEIYSDLPRPLLTEYSFFKGLSGGKLLFNSVIDGSKSKSILKIEDFKVVNAPGVIKLLSLADLRGLADLAEGEGLSFDLLEIDMEKNKKLLKINEILALGPSVSVLMEGYQDDSGITSLRGTLVPAKTLNKIISKIPIIGSIIIPKEAGEGLFGISFKMKGPKGKIKTTINPIRTLTPRFIQKIIDRNKETK